MPTADSMGWRQHAVSHRGVKEVTQNVTLIQRVKKSCRYDVEH